jgi:creatinine amidohydrolase/Fe(II)-dependent formamide hydrolase-like protein
VTPGGDAHAGRTETSLLLTIDPAAVRLHLAEPGRTEPITTLLPRLRAEGVRPVSSNGVLGDPTGANAEEGRALLDDLVRDLATAVAGHWTLS